MLNSLSKGKYVWYTPTWGDAYTLSEKEIRESDVIDW